MLWDHLSGEMVSLAVTVFSDDIIPGQKSHLIYTMEGTYLQSDFSYTSLQWRPGDGMESEC